VSELVFLRFAFCLFTFAGVFLVAFTICCWQELAALKRRESWRLRRDEEDGLRSILKRLGGRE